MDMITDDMLLRILSLLPTKYVPTTSLVSKRWQSLWSLVSRIEFDDSKYQNDDADYTSFTQSVYRTLSLNKAPVLHTLILKLSSKCHAVDIGIWTDTAVARRVHKLSVRIRKGSGPVNLPRSLYTCKTLENLTLERCLVSDVLCLPSLKILRLSDVDYTFLPRVLSGCPNLEELLVQFVRKEDEGKDNIVAGPCLRILRMNDTRYGTKGGVYAIEAPCVEHLKIVDVVVYNSRRIENMPNLVKAHVDITQGVTHKFLRALASARRLYLCVSLVSEVPTLVVFFYRLVHLELNTYAQSWWDLLTQMLENSPKLASLKLTNVHEPEFPSKETPDCWKRPSSIPDSLETFAWSGYRGRRGDLEMATYVIKNSTRLKTASISPPSNDAEAKYRIFKDLVSVLMPSPSFRLLFD